MRSSVLAVALLVIGAVAGPAAAADKRSDKNKQFDDTQAAYYRYLQLARVTPPETGAPRWIDNLLGDPRARTVNDLLTVNVIESVNATGSADSSVSKASTGTASVGNLLGLQPKTPKVIDTSSDTTFKGGGSTTRTGQLTTNLTVRVAEVLPNGNLVLEGAREVQINGDRQLFVLTGIVRPVDIAPNNVVLSTAIAQLHVQYIGNGLLRDSLSPGWLVRILNKVF